VKTVKPSAVRVFISLPSPFPCLCWRNSNEAMNDMNVTEYIVAVMSRHFWFTCHIQHHKLLDKTDRIS
jgi:hypothetical protein